MKYFLIVNPVSGNKDGIILVEKILPILESNGSKVDLIISNFKGHPYEIAKTFEISNYDAIALVGGDGSMHEVINGMMDRPDKKILPIGLITAGTGNSLMHDLDALDPIEASKKIVEGKKLKIDLAKIQMEDKQIFAFNVIGWGLPVTINDRAEKMRFFGPQRYNIASILEILRNPKWPVRFVVDGEEINGTYAFFLACNTIYTGNGMKIAPKAQLNDGKFDVILLKEASRWKLIKLFTKIFSGNHIHDPLIKYIQAKEFSVSDTNKKNLNIDGQNTGSCPFNMKVIEKAIEIFH